MKKQKRRKLRTWVKVVIYLVLVMVGAKLMSKTKVQTKIVENEKTIVITIKENEQTESIEQVEEETTTNEIAFTNENEINIFNKCLEQGLTKEQAFIVISISRHETGNWTSSAFIERHNFGGIMCNGATQIKSYSSYEEGLNDFIRVLKTIYFEQGLITIEQIGAKYCPVGAENDPNGLNKYWVGGVSTFYQEYLTLA